LRATGTTARVFGLLGALGAGLAVVAVGCAEGTVVPDIPDNDGDGFVETIDCNDADPFIKPDQPERCDGVDNDCDGSIDEDAVDVKTWYRDNDGDNYAVLEGESTQGCEQPAGFASIGGDCNDDDPDVHPGAEETCEDDIDYNCDGSTAFDDNDEDGHAACADCDDGDPAINPDAAEICDGIDNDCDDAIDDNDEPLEVICPNVPFGEQVCNGEDGCAIASCDANYYDINTTYSDGCECVADPLPLTAGATCATAIELGNFTDAAADFVTVTGRAAPANREIWYVFSGIDDSDTAGDEYHVDVRFLQNPGSGYRIDAYRGGCPPTGGGVTQIAADEATIVDWYTDQPFQATGCTLSNPCGQGNCVPAANQAARCQCTNDSGSFYVRVYRQDGAGSCDDFEIQVSNGLF
jgi:hypothetical protein